LALQMKTLQTIKIKTNLTSAQRTPLLIQTISNSMWLWTPNSSKHEQSISGLKCALATTWTSITLLECARASPRTVEEVVSKAWEESSGIRKRR